MRIEPANGRRTIRLASAAAALCLLALLTASPAEGQTAGTAAISGRVVLEQDASGLPGMTVTARDDERGTEFTAVTDASGAYRISLLRPSTYTLTVNQQGFSPYRRTGNTTVVGQEAVIEIRLRPAVTETVEVTGETELIDPTTSQVASNVTPQQVRTLPLPTRNYLELALLAPGTTPGRDVAFSGVVGGGAQESRWTYISLDGADNNNFIVGGQQANVSQDTVQEFQVLTYNFSAEYGRSNAVVVNVLTRSGTNALHGSVYTYFRNEDLTEDPFFPVPEQQTERINFGATLGGPIVPDRAFFFLSYDDLDLESSLPINIPTRPDLSSVAPVTTERQLAFAKVDVNISSPHRLTLSYRYDDRNQTNLGVGGRAAASYGYAQATTTQGAIFSHQWVPSSVFYNEARGTWLDFDQSSTPNSNEPGRQHPSYSFGGNPRFPQGGVETRWGIADTMAWTIGKHFFRFGGEYSRWKGDVFFDLFSRGLFTFQSNAADAAPFVFIGGFGDPTTVNELDFYAAFVQDEWRISDRLTANLGLRWDYQDGAANADFESPWGIPNAREEDSNNFQPRLGFAYDLSGRGKTIIRGGGGIFHFQLFNNLSLNEDIFNGQDFRVAVFPCFAVPGGCDVNNPPSANVPQPSQIRMNDEDLQTPYTVTYSLGFVSEVMTNWAASVDAVYSRGYHELGEIRENLRTNPALTTSPRPDPRIADIRRVHSGADSWYYALLTSVRKAFSDGWQAQLSYTWSKCTNESEFFGIAASDSRAESPFDVDKGPCRSDQRHRFVANGSYELPWGFQVGSILTWASGQPYSAFSGVDINVDDAPPFGQDRPPGFSRNSELSDPYFRWDLRLSKRFDLGPVGVELIGEVFNVINHENFDPATYGNVIPPDIPAAAGAPPRYSAGFPIPATFGQPGPSTSDLYQPRQFQLAARVTF